MVGREERGLAFGDNGDGAGYCGHVGGVLRVCIMPECVERCNSLYFGCLQALHKQWV